MRKVIAAMNITLDGFCDHTAGIPDAELHQHFSDLLHNSDTLIYGRTTYQLMESYWPNVVKNPTGEQATDDFAVSIDNIHKVVFSTTLKHVGWKNVTLATRGVEEEVLALKQQTGRDILVGSPSMIAALTKLPLIDEYQLCIHPVIIGSGLPLFKTITERTVLNLTQTKRFGSGILGLYYEPVKNESGL